MTGFYIKRNTGLKWVKAFPQSYSHMNFVYANAYVNIKQCQKDHGTIWKD